MLLRSAGSSREVSICSASRDTSVEFAPCALKVNQGVSVLTRNSMKQLNYQTTLEAGTLETLKPLWSEEKNVSVTSDWKLAGSPLYNLKAVILEVLSGDYSIGIHAVNFVGRKMSKLYGARWDRSNHQFFPPLSSFRKIEVDNIKSAKSNIRRFNKFMIYVDFYNRYFGVLGITTDRLSKLSKWNIC